MDFKEYTPDDFTDNSKIKTIHEIWNEIPLLNVVESYKLRDQQLVRFRGMVQDMYSPEYYVLKSRIHSKQDDSVIEESRSGKYKDSILYNEETEYIHLDRAVQGDRQTFVVVTEPALNEWVKEEEEKKHRFNMDVEGSTSVNNKRYAEEAMETDSGTGDNPTPSCSHDNSPNKKHKNDGVTDNETKRAPSKVSQEHLLNFPIPSRMGKVCHVKMYDVDTDSIQLNEVAEFVGFLSINPLTMETTEGYDDDEMEMLTKNPPPSLIPRIHCIAFKKINSYNPLINTNTNDTALMTSQYMREVYKELHTVLTQLLLGDTLAAEYLIFHLISRVYLRRDYLPLGKFSLNISNVPVAASLGLDNYTENLYSFIELLLTKSHYFPMTLNNMNTEAFVPKKDYTCNRLTTGLLQLSPNTHLVVDETKLTPGQLNSNGINALKVFTNVINNQSVSYDLNFYPLSFNCDIPFLILSEGKSLLPSDCHVVLEPIGEYIETFPDVMAAVRQLLKRELLDAIRKYLTFSRDIRYDIEDSARDFIQNEFVKMRQADQTVNGSDLHLMLGLSRLISISQGNERLSEESWRKAESLERQRKARIAK